MQGFDFYEFENKTLLVTGAGAKLKVYNLSQNNLKEVQSWSLNCGEVYSIAFSQDGKELAVGCRYKPAVAIYEVKQTEKEIILQFSFYPNLENLKEATSLCYNDGHLYSTDSYKYTNKKDSNTIRRWENNGRGGFIDIPASHSGVWACLPSKYGGIYYAATHDFGLGRINADGKREYLLLPPDEQYKHIGENFAVSHDGRNFQFSKEKNLLLYFDKENKRLEKISYPKTELKTAIQKTNTLHITNWQNSDKPVVNNIALRLENREISLSASVHPNEKEFVIGTNYWIRYYNSDGKLLWKTKELLPNVRGVVISGNGEFLVAALGDGTIRWFRTKDGEPFLSFMSSQTPNAEGEWTWILWTAKPKEGYYDTVFGGESFLGWAFYLSEDLFEYYTIDNYRKEFYRPDAIDKVFETFDINLAFQAAEKEYGIKAISHPSFSAPPLIDIKFELEGFVSKEQNIDILL